VTAGAPGPTGRAPFGDGPVAPSRIGPGDQVLVTGGTGFIGSAVSRQLLALGADVRVLTQPGSAVDHLDPTVEVVPGDVRDPASVRQAVKGVRMVFHLAALYRFWAPDPRLFVDINVTGTRNVIDEATSAGCERIVYTSTVGTLGLADASLATPVDERSPADVAHLFGPYKRSKYVAEHEALRAAAEGSPVVVVQPTMPVGPGDRRPTPTGRTILDYLNGRIPAVVDTTLNIVDVDDVARGHVLAAERGRVGRSYILGGENLPFADVIASLGAITGLPTPTWRMPTFVALGVALVSDTVEGRLLGREPSVPREAARMAATHMAFDDRRARCELGYTSRPAADALERAARWFVDRGDVSPARVAAITWRSPARNP